MASLESLISAMMKEIDTGYNTKKNKVESGYNSLADMIQAEIERQVSQYDATKGELEVQGTEDIAEMRDNVDQDMLSRGLSRSSHAVESSAERESKILSNIARVLAKAATDKDININELNRQKTSAFKDKEMTLLDLLSEAQASKESKAQQLRYQDLLHQQQLAAAARARSGSSSRGYSKYDYLNAYRNRQQPTSKTSGYNPPPSAGLTVTSWFDKQKAAQKKPPKPTYNPPSSAGLTVSNWFNQNR